uniref:Secreted protein n=1 Tax=Anopheles darlingi TaxID=43151 RepID=A0A2M4DJD1_ANODA
MVGLRIGGWAGAGAAVVVAAAAVAAADGCCLVGEEALVSPPSLSSEMWQFQPLSSPIFSEKTRERSSFSLLKCTNRMQARSSRSINCTISVCAWYCIVTMPMNTWWLCIR